MYGVTGESFEKFDEYECPVDGDDEGWWTEWSWNERRRAGQRSGTDGETGKSRETSAFRLNVNISLSLSFRSSACLLSSCSLCHVVRRIRGSWYVVL